MPEKATVERARRDRRQGKSSSTAAGEFVREEMHHIREGKHGAKSAKQAIAIGLSKARRAGFDPGPEPASAKGAKRKASPRRSTAASRRGATSKTRARAATKALKRQPRRAASHLALSRQAHSAARRRTKADRSASARKAARTRAR